ncbi:hypothetical protein [Streptomyces sp. G45]|uniref:hypothetical protein n=1 Tax=Streptomyces sp. G45 TaxID=3406627 RepID=UPI003C21DF80
MPTVRERPAEGDPPRAALRHPPDRRNRRPPLRDSIPCAYTRLPEAEDAFLEPEQYAVLRDAFVIVIVENVPPSIGYVVLNLPVGHPDRARTWSPTPDPGASA